MWSYLTKSNCKGTHCRPRVLCILSKKASSALRSGWTDPRKSSLKISRRLQPTQGWCGGVQLHGGAEVQYHRERRTHGLEGYHGDGGSWKRWNAAQSKWSATDLLCKRIALAGLEGEQHGRGMESVVDGRERWPLSLKRSSTQPW